MTMVFRRSLHYSQIRSRLLVSRLSDGDIALHGTYTIVIEVAKNKVETSRTIFFAREFVPNYYITSSNKLRRIAKKLSYV